MNNVQKTLQSNLLVELQCTKVQLDILKQAILVCNNNVDRYPRGENFRGTIDSLLMASSYLLSTASNLIISSGDSDVHRFQLDSAKTLIDNAGYDELL